MTIYVFGYGSLINMELNKELTQPKKITPVMVKGLKRSLNVIGPLNKQLVFGVKDVKTANCNGILIKVNLIELEKIQKREKLYTMKKLEQNRIVFHYNKSIKFNTYDEIICFYPQSKYVVPKTQLAAKPVIMRYIDICAEGAKQISSEFYDDFIDTTYGIDIIE